MATYLSALGLVTAIGGILIEGLAVSAMSFYPVRRSLPWSPFSLVGLGFFCFLGGSLLLACGAFR